MSDPGYLQVLVTTGSSALPIENATVIIKDKAGSQLYSLKTNEDGLTIYVSLDAPSVDLTLDPIHKNLPYATYDVEVYAEGYSSSVVKNVQIFSTISSTLPVSMQPMPRTGEAGVQVFDIPPNALDTDIQMLPEAPREGGRVLKAVVIPEFVVVHLGTPSSNARNVWVRFIDYIKNVASSEIYPTWPQNSLIANIHAQVSLVLNRIFTEWYPSRGYNFDITNSTQYDQYYIEGRNIFDTISRAVDLVFNLYVKRINSIAPLFTTYCNGTTVTCKGMSQWGTVPLANQGKTPLEILKYYYGNDIELGVVTSIGGVTSSFPGVPLEEGDNNTSVRTIQIQLSRIRLNYPSIPRILMPDGDFKADTTSAVKEFQKIFSLPQTGKVDKGTWYKISYIYTAVKKLAELSAEAEEEGIGLKPPTTTIRQGSSGQQVKDLQFILNYIGDFYSSIPPIKQTGYFDGETRNAVIEFQKTFGLAQDGVVGPGTWSKLYDVYNGINKNVESTPFPGIVLRLGSVGENVRLMQTYLNAISNSYPSIPKVTADGVFGPATQNAVIAFQKQFGLTPDGLIGKQTWDKIVSVYKNESLPYPGTALRVGSVGENVRIMQTYLNSISNTYPSIPKVTADGIFGPATRDAVIAFQRQFGLTPDGVIGRQTWDKIVSVYKNKTIPYPGTALRVGSRGDNVKLMQTRLNTIANKYTTIPKVTADGVFGAKTEAAVMAFQRLFGLVPDGVIGRLTWEKIIEQSS